MKQVCLSVRFHPVFCDLLLRGGRHPGTWTDGDIEEFDPDFLRYKVQWIRTNDPECLDLDFTDVLDDRAAAQRLAGSEARVPLLPGGESVPVTAANKDDYVQRICRWRMLTSIQLQTQAVLRGLHTIVTKDTLRSLGAMITPTELSNLLSGLPLIDVDDWERRTVYTGGYKRTTQLIKWFWEAVRSFTAEEHELLLQFATGSRRPPVGGFANLQGFAGGLHLFTVNCAKSRSRQSLPTAHACICTIDVPEYANYDEVRQRLHVAVTLGCKGFDHVGGDGEHDDVHGNDGGNLTEPPAK